ETAFDEWLAIRRAAWRKQHPDATMQVNFIATQGGGIRALNWTTRTLHFLDSAYNGFLRQTFVISGVSGGGVGAMAYLAFRHDQHYGSIQTPDADSVFKAFTRRGFLSPLTASLAFGDNLQKLLPMPIAALERSNILGRTSENDYPDMLGTNTFSES